MGFCSNFVQENEEEIAIVLSKRSFEIINGIFFPHTQRSILLNPKNLILIGFDTETPKLEFETTNEICWSDKFSFSMDVVWKYTFFYAFWTKQMKRKCVIYCLLEKTSSRRENIAIINFNIASHTDQRHRKGTARAREKDTVWKKNESLDWSMLACWATSLSGSLHRKRARDRSDLGFDPRRYKGNHGSRTIYKSFWLTFTYCTLNCGQIFVLTPQSGAFQIFNRNSSPQIILLCQLAT